MQLKTGLAAVILAVALSLAVSPSAATRAADTLPAHSRLDGQNILARWTRALADESDLSLQFFADRTWRDDIPSTLAVHLETYDFDLRHRFPVGERQSLRWGLAYRLMPNEVHPSTTFVGLLPPRRNMQLASGFVQDEIVLRPDRWSLMVGTKVEHNDYSGFEFEPSVRIACSRPSPSFASVGAYSRCCSASAFWPTCSRRPSLSPPIA